MSLRIQKKNTQSLDNLESCVDKVIQIVGSDIRLGIPLGTGKPNPFVNALYRRVKSDPSLTLKIYTALTLGVPKGKSLLEKRFLKPFTDRVLNGYPNLDYGQDSKLNRLPDNIEVFEFYFQAGKSIDNSKAQENYISSNYTHVARDLLDAGVNVVAQIVSPGKNDEVSLSCNPDVTLDLMEGISNSRVPHCFVAQINSNLPFMYGDAKVSKDIFDIVIENPSLEFPLFGTPKMSVSNTDYSIALLASSLIKDGGELQIGIGSLGDALAHSLLVRQNKNDEYRKLVSELTLSRYDQIISEKGGLAPFEEGLFAASEMFVDCFMYLIDSNIIKRKVYDHVILQRLINEGLITETVSPEMIYRLIEYRAISPKLTPSDFDFLVHFGIFRSNVTFSNGFIQLKEDQKIEADFNKDESHNLLIKEALGSRLKNGAIVHGGFFLGPQKFYDWLKDLPDEKLKSIHMNSVTKINQLYGNEELDRLHRKNARFVNTCLKMTLLGAAVSDGLDNGQVISGVGGQYNFVSMAQALPDGHSIIQLRSTRSSSEGLKSNIVFNYGHVTIPRHLRDFVITEYGIAYIRGKSDSEVISSLIEISDSRFQKELIAKSKSYGKLKKSYQLPDSAKNNYPERINTTISKAKELCPDFPFGTDFTDDEILLGKALKGLKRKSKSEVLKLLATSFGLPPDKKRERLLERLSLLKASTVKDKFFKRLISAELRKWM